MPEISYRIYLNDEPATREQLDRVEEITVEQTVDMAWEGRFQIPIRTDESGRWSGEDEELMESFGRLRVEVKVGADGSYVPLIDGPVVGWDSRMSAEPGQSVLTVIVHDDSVYLNRRDIVDVLENQLDHEIAEQLFGEIQQIADTDIEPTPATSTGLPPVEVQRGTAIQLLRSLARRQGMHAYVLPGRDPGRSIGVFKPLPTEAADLPTLTLLGPERNIAEFNVENQAQRPGEAGACTLSITDKSVHRATSSFRDLELLGEETAFENEADVGRRLLPPGAAANVDPDRAVGAAAAESAYAFRATGEVMEGCFVGVLRPYLVVRVAGVNGRLSGDYLIEQVTHRLTRSNYSQSFRLRRNARSSGSAGDSFDLPGPIF